MTQCVDQDTAGGEFARHTGPFRVRRAYVGDEAEFGVIGDFNGLGFRVSQVQILSSSYPARMWMIGRVSGTVLPSRAAR